jgi:hypothetical protein
MSARGWPLQAQPARLGGPATFHVTMTAGVAARLDDLVAALSASVEAARGHGRVDPDPQLAALAASLDPAGLDDAAVDGLLVLAGLGGDGTARLLPARMAPVHALLEAVPPALVERLLIGVMNRVYGG